MHLNGRGRIGAQWSGGMREVPQTHGGFLPLWPAFLQDPCLVHAGAFLNGVIVSVFLTQMRQGRVRLGEEDSDVDIEGFEEEEEDGKPKTPAPVSIFDPICSLLVDFCLLGRSCGSAGHFRVMAHKPKSVSF